MLSGLSRLLGHQDPKTPTPAAPTAVAERERTPLPHRAATPVPDVPPTPRPTGMQLEKVLRGMLGQRRERVLARIADEANAGDSHKVFDQLGDHLEQIRQLPTAAQQALSALSNPDVAIGQLAKLFGADPALSQSLLRTANSAYYRTESEIVSIPAAINRIGMGGVRGVLMVHSVESMLCRPGDRYEPMLAQVWKHMVRTAPIARSIAASFGADAEQAFVLGLLHDVGKLAVFDRLAALRGMLRRVADVPPGVLDFALMELHEPLGGLAALRWGLGEHAAHAIATHHRHEPQGPDPYSETLFLAERLDLARAKERPLDAKAWFEDGRITGPVAALLASSANPESLLLV